MLLTGICVHLNQCGDCSVTVRNIDTLMMQISGLGAFIALGIVTHPLTRDHHALSAMASAADDKENLPSPRLHTTPPPSQR